jgi:hypothetical protein
MHTDFWQGVLRKQSTLGHNIEPDVGEVDLRMPTGLNWIRSHLVQWRKEALTIVNVSIKE